MFDINKIFEDWDEEEEKTEYSLSDIKIGDTIEFTYKDIHGKLKFKDIVKIIDKTENHIKIKKLKTKAICVLNNERFANIKLWTN